MRFPQAISKLALALAMVATLMVAPTAAEAAEPTPQQRMEFKKLVKQRDTLVVALTKLDRQAADALKRGEKPLKIYAEQVGTQERLDLVDLRLNLLSTRHDMDIPPSPLEQAKEQATKQPQDKTLRVFEIGRRRAIAQLEADAEQMLQSIEFTAFLQPE